MLTLMYSNVSVSRPRKVAYSKLPVQETREPDSGSMTMMAIPQVGRLWDSFMEQVQTQNLT